MMMSQVKTARAPSHSRASMRSTRCQAATTTSKHTVTKSAEIFKEAQDLLPGGVNSPVRAFKSVGLIYQ